MLITSVRYAFTRNLGNYESVKVEVEASPSENQNPETVITELRSYVEANLPGAVNTVLITAKSAGNETTTAKPRNPRTKKADKLKAPGSIAEAVEIAGTLEGVQLATFFNACRDDQILTANLDDFTDLCKTVAEQCQATCEVGSVERAAIAAALKCEKLRREGVQAAS